MGSEVRQAWRLRTRAAGPPREPGRQGAHRPRHPPPVPQGRRAPARPSARAPGAPDGPGRPEPLPPGLPGPPGVRALPQAPPRGDGRGAGDRLRSGAAAPRLPGAGPGDLPRPDGLLHRPLVRAGLPRRRCSSGTSGSSSTARRPSAKDRRVVLEGPEFEIVEEDDPASIHMGRVVPVYPLTEGLFQRRLREFLHGLVEAHAGKAPDILPDELRRRRNLLPARRGVPGACTSPSSSTTWRRPAGASPSRTSSCCRWV